MIRFMQPKSTLWLALSSTVIASCTSKYNSGLFDEGSG